MESKLTDEDVRALLARYGEALHKYCYTLTGTGEAADDLCQEALATAWETRHSFEGRSSFRMWLCGIAKNKARNEWRKKRELLSEDGVLDDTESGLEVLKGLTGMERENFVLECVGGLDPVEQEVVFLRYAQEIPLEEITKVLDIQLASGARGVLQRIKRTLGREMRARLGEMGHGSSFVRTTW